MSATFSRRLGIVAGYGAVYVGTVAATYYYFTAGAQDQKETAEKIEQGKSFYHSKDRNLKFSAIADAYDTQIGRDEFFMGINWLRRSLLYFHAKGQILEVGAGTGRNLPYYPSTCSRIVLMDASDEMLNETRRKIGEITPESRRKKFACYKGDAEKLKMSWPDNCFDTVIDTFGLCSYNDPVEALNEMARVCKPNGKILLLEHGRSKSWDGITSYLDKHAERHAKNWGCCWNRDLDDMIEKANLSVDRKDTWHFGTTYYIVCRPDKESEVEINN